VRCLTQELIFASARGQQRWRKWAAGWAATSDPPPVPELKPTVVDSKTTALLILDLMKANCGKRPWCLATVPNYTTRHALRACWCSTRWSAVRIRHPPISSILGSRLVKRMGCPAWAGQIPRLPLEERLKAHGIKTVIVTGTSAQGAVVGTGSGAAQRGYKVIVPVDGMSADHPYMEQYAAWHLYK
jgi:Isochorismatase family